MKVSDIWWKICFPHILFFLLSTFLNFVRCACVRARNRKIVLIFFGIWQQNFLRCKADCWLGHSLKVKILLTKEVMSSHCVENIEDVKLKVRYFHILSYKHSRHCKLAFYEKVQAWAEATWCLDTSLVTWKTAVVRENAMMMRQKVKSIKFLFEVGASACGEAHEISLRIFQSSSISVSSRLSQRQQYV